MNPKKQRCNLLLPLTVPQGKSLESVGFVGAQTRRVRSSPKTGILTPLGGIADLSRQRSLARIRCVALAFSPPERTRHDNFGKAESVLCLEWRCTMHRAPFAREQVDCLVVQESSSPTTNVFGDHDRLATVSPILRRLPGAGLLQQLFNGISQSCNDQNNVSETFCYRRFVCRRS